MSYTYSKVSSSKRSVNMVEMPLMMMNRDARRSNLKLKAQSSNLLSALGSSIRLSAQLDLREST